MRSVNDMIEEFTHRRVAVIGIARSGLAAAEVLTARGADVTLLDGKPATEIGDALAAAEALGIAALAGVERVGDADLIVTSPGVPADAPILTDAVNRGIPVWGEIEAAYRIARAPILAVTGTNGKTTTTALLGAMAAQAGYRTFVGGNIAAGPSALPLIRAAHQAKAEDVIVAEISSFQLEWTEKFRPRVAAILNITTDHSDRQSWDAYVAAKWRIAQAQHATDTLVLRSDVPRPVTIGTPASKEIRFDTLTYPLWIKRILLPGEHNAENVMAARAMATAFGIGEDAIREASLHFRGVVHRLEFVTEIDGVQWINNSMCTNNDAFGRSLDAIEGRKVVIAGGVFKGGDATPIGVAASSPSIRAVVLFGKSAQDLADVCRENGAQSVTVVQTLTEAVNVARALAVPGDTIMLSPACASFDQFRNFEDRGDQFKALVNGLAPAERFAGVSA
jgi:UDP-N-acetylmuramoylalanine--D-glutamate ligase